MLSFKVAFTHDGEAGETVGWGSGSACNLIQEIRILSKNGCEVDRTQSAHVLAKIMKDYTYSLDGQNMLSNAGVDLGGMVKDTFYSFVIPLSLLSGFFRPTVKGMKIPAGLASGMRIELTLARPDRAVELTGGVGTLSYLVQNPEMLFCCSDLNDPTQAVLMKNSAETGLEYTFPAYFSTTLTEQSTQINEQVKKAVSQCTRAFASVYDVSGAGSVMLNTNDGFKSIDSDQLKSYQFRVGANYYPQKFVDSEAEALFISCATFDKIRDMRTNACPVAVEDYETGGKFIVGHPLETDDRLNLSGIPLNNSSVLELRMEVKNTGGVSRQFEIFIEYISVARTFVNRTTLKI
jgi:hypothetical protein